MKKKTLLPVLLMTLLAAAYAKQPKPLDAATLIEPVPLTRISILVGDNVDTDRQGENFLKEIFPDYIDLIVQEMSSNYGITVDPTPFREEVAAGTVQVSLEVIDFGGKIKFHEYTWAKEAQPSPRASFVLGFVMRDDGTMPLTVSFKQDDPKYKPGYALSFEMALSAAKENGY